MMVETHILKPYKQSVENTYELMKNMIKITKAQGDKITELLKKAIRNLQAKKRYALNWEIDTVKRST